MITSVIEEAEAISWYEQRISVEKDEEAKAIMGNAQNEETKHFGKDLEFLLRKKPAWREMMKIILFTKGDIVERGRGLSRKRQRINLHAPSLKKIDSYAVHS